MVRRLFPHILKDNKTCKIPGEFIFFDCETKEIIIDENTKEHQLRLGCAIYWRRRNDTSTDTIEKFDFREADEFWEWSLNKSRPKSRLIFISHNLGFDFKVLSGFRTLKEKGYKIEKLIFNYQTNIFKFRKDKQSLLFLDNMNYFRTSLKVLGESVGLNKLDIPQDNDDDDIWLNYCRRDVDILYHSWKNWLSFLKENDLGTFGMTLPSQALNAFRHRFNANRIYIHHNPEITKIERAAYHGGRTECFFLGKLEGDTYYNLDINSAYPYVMGKYEYPANYIYKLDYPSINKLKSVLEKYCVIALVAIETPENLFPYKKEERLIFPVGRFKTTLTTRELEYALRKKYIINVDQMVVYQKAPLFKSYVDYFYTQRKKYKNEGNQAFSYICKLFLNSLYGKWGQKNEIFETIGEDESFEDCIIREWDVEENQYITYRIINGKIEKSTGYEEGYNSFPAISAHITADTRLLLYHYMCKAGKDNIYYVDTDSLFTNKKGYANLIDDINNHTLGKLKVEKIGKTLEIRGLKDYTFDNETKIKGISKDAFPFSQQKYIQWEFEGLRGSLHYNNLNRQLVRKIVKTLRRDYTKGIITDTGRIKPFIIQEV